MNQDLSRRLFTAGLLLAPTGVFAQAASLSAADKALVDKAVAYLQGLNRARGRFTQTDPRGARAAGTFYMQRPGKVRFEYDPPNKITVISDGNQLAVQNEMLKTDSRYPLSTTPLALFLAREIRLDRGVQVTKVTREDGGFSITAKDSGRATPGQLVLSFGDSPMVLKGWTVIGAQGQTTRTQLSALSVVSSLEPSLFRLPPRAVAGSRRP